MPILMRSDEAKSLIHLECMGDVKTEEIVMVMNDLLSVLNRCHSRMDCLMDWSAVENYPDFMAAATPIASVLVHPFMGYVALVGLNTFLAYWMEYFRKAAGLRYVKFDTLLEAQTFFDELHEIAARKVG